MKHFLHLLLLYSVLCQHHCQGIIHVVALTLVNTVKDYKRISEVMAQACIESVVKERYGSKPFRVFRLLMLKKLLEQKQVSDMALIPQKEAKEMLYSLLAENFVSLQVSN